MIKKIQAYLIRTRIKSLTKVRRNAIDAGWPTVVSETDRILREHQQKLIECES